MLISHSRRFILLTRRRCGGQQAAAALDSFADVRGGRAAPYRVHETLASLEAHFQAMGWPFADYFVFTTVRDPRAMLASLYVFGRPDRAGRYWWDRHGAALDAGLAVRGPDRVPPDPVGFRDWVTTADLSAFALDPHLVDRQGRRRADAVLRCERWAEDWRDLLRRLNLPDLGPPALPAAEGEGLEWDAAMLARTAEVFRTDLEVGGYSF